MCEDIALMCEDVARAKRGAGNNFADAPARVTFLVEVGMITKVWEGHARFCSTRLWLCFQFHVLPRCPTQSKRVVGRILGAARLAIRACVSAVVVVDC
jgi:hypothetical protein